MCLDRFWLLARTGNDRNSKDTRCYRTFAYRTLRKTIRQPRQLRHRHLEDRSKVGLAEKDDDDDGDVDGDCFQNDSLVVQDVDGCLQSHDEAAVGGDNQVVVGQAESLVVGPKRCYWAAVVPDAVVVVMLQGAVDSWGYAACETFLENCQNGF